MEIKVKGTDFTNFKEAICHSNSNGVKEIPIKVLYASKFFIVLKGVNFLPNNLAITIANLNQV